jgi:class 3 adenylate cyclase
MPEDRRHAAIMFTDIVGYTALMGKDEDRAFDMLRRNHSLHQNLIVKHDGKLIKEIGDGTLASFPLSSNAVRCAIDIQKEAKEQNIPLKIGIHEGEMVFAGIDVLGDSVNIASRLQENAREGCINISDSVYRNIKSKADIQTRLIGEKSFKNVDEPIKVYRVLLGDEIDDQLRLDEKEKKPKSKILYYILAGLTILIIGILLFWKFYPTETTIELRKTIAVGVLPFRNLNIDTDKEWLVAGQRETLITELSKLSQVEPLLRVIGSYTMNSFRNSEKSLAEIAREIPVDYLIEG